jgi:hypothetical protein
VATPREMDDAPTDGEVSQFCDRLHALAFLEANANQQRGSAPPRSVT